MSVGLSGAVLLALAPLTGPSAAGATVRVMGVNPSQVEGCDVDPAGPCDEEATPIVTVTVTEDPQGGGSEETAVPQKTVTTTITVPASPKPPKKTTAPPPPPPQETEAAQPPPPIQNTAPPPVTPPAETGTEDTEPQFPATSPDPNQQLPAVTPTPTPSDTATLDESASGSSVYEIRNAGSEFDGATLSRQLGIPALILVLLVLFAVLIFEGRLRRLAHAAAVRRAGPRGIGRDPMDPMAYSGGPGYGPYQGGTAYAPIISFVPMQMYAPVYPEGYTPEQYPHGYDQTTAYLPAPGYEQHPAAGHGVPYDPQTGHVQPQPYGPAVHDGSTAAFQGTPRPGSGAGLGEGRLQGAPEFPGAPFPQEPARGDLGVGGPRDGFRPAGPGADPVSGSLSGPVSDPGPKDVSGQEPRGDLSGPERPAGESRPLGPEPQGGPARGPGETGSGDGPAGGGRPPAEPTPTAVYPLPGQDTGKKKRGLFRRST
ncbi:hypothetical protein [Streptosporangium sp. NPDC048865]|uniref:hypothetical protein n=1 Tax=Streptosporangium sp. NPDC048865 TaxID=3155766 RepID=UPI0034301142